MLDLETVLDSSGDEVNRYHLHSIIVHNGTIDSGHYYTFIRPTLEDRWFKFNDGVVHEVPSWFAMARGIGGTDPSF